MWMVDFPDSAVALSVTPFVCISQLIFRSREMRTLRPSSPKHYGPPHAPSLLAYLAYPRTLVTLHNLPAANILLHIFTSHARKSIRCTSDSTAKTVGIGWINVRSPSSTPHPTNTLIAETNREHYNSLFPRALHYCTSLLMPWVNISHKYMRIRKKHIVSNGCMELQCFWWRGKQESMS